MNQFKSEDKLSLVANVFAKAIRGSVEGVYSVENTILSGNNIFCDVQSKSPLKEEESKKILDLVVSELKEIIFTEGLFIKNLSGLNSADEAKNKGFVTRINIFYFNDANLLNNYLKNEVEMLERDHRKIGQELKLWTFSELVGAGLPLFTPQGTIVRNALYEALVSISKRYGAELVTIPHIAKRQLYEVSGHAQKFGDELIKVISHHDEFVMKPVNCPHHTQIYASEIRSYKDLPISYIESTMQYRDEQPGEISGLTRVRAITVDDGHTFCTKEQIKQEVINLAEVIKEFYSGLGMWENHWVSLSTRDLNHLEKYIGEEEDWKIAEDMLKDISEELELSAKECPGEAALYGPKLDYMFTDSLGRERQLATIQIDFSMPKRFGLSYIGKDGGSYTPVMIHRAVLGSYERFIAILLEHFNGWLPCWLAPVQVALLPVSLSHEDFTLKLHTELIKSNIKSKKITADSNSLGKRLRQAKLLKVPFIIVIGDEEVQSGNVKIQLNKTGEKIWEGSFSEGIEYIEKYVLDKVL